MVALTDDVGIDDVDNIVCTLLLISLAGGTSLNFVHLQHQQIGVTEGLKNSGDK